MVIWVEGKEEVESQWVSFPTWPSIYSDDLQQDTGQRNGQRVRTFVVTCVWKAKKLNSTEWVSEFPHRAINLPWWYSSKVELQCVKVSTWPAIYSVIFIEATIHKHQTEKLYFHQCHLHLGWRQKKRVILWPCDPTRPSICPKILDANHPSWRNRKIPLAFPWTCKQKLLKPLLKLSHQNFKDSLKTKIWIPDPQVKIYHRQLTLFPSIASPYHVTGGLHQHGGHPHPPPPHMTR